MNTNLTGRFSLETATQPTPEAKRLRLDHSIQPIDHRADRFEESFDVTIELLEFEDGEE